MKRNSSKSVELTNEGWRPDKTIRCLYIDDSDVSLMTMKTRLEKLGVEMEITNSTQEALNKCKTSKFDLVIVDYHMPFLNGLELAQLIKLEPYSESKDAIFLGFSSLPMDELYELDLQHILDGCLIKTLN